jgi:hypothetical protein
MMTTRRSMLMAALVALVAPLTRWFRPAPTSPQETWPVIENQLETIVRAPEVVIRITESLGGGRYHGKIVEPTDDEWREAENQREQQVLAICEAVGECPASFDPGDHVHARRAPNGALVTFAWPLIDCVDA